MARPWEAQVGKGPFARNKLTALLFEKFKSGGVEVGALDKVAFDRS